MHNGWNIKHTDTNTYMLNIYVLYFIVLVVIEASISLRKKLSGVHVGSTEFSRIYNLSVVEPNPSPLKKNGKGSYLLECEGGGVLGIDKQCNVL